MGNVWNMNKGKKWREKNAFHQIKFSCQLTIKYLNLEVDPHTGGKWLIHGSKKPQG